MSHYTYVLAKYDISDCKTFEDVKSKFPDTGPAYLRKIIHLKGLRITEEGKLMGTSKEKMLVQQGPSNHRRPISFLGRESFMKQKQKRYPKVNCPQCGKEIFLVYPNDPFCSTKCRREFRKTRAHAKKMKKKETSIQALRGRLCPECRSTRIVRDNERAEIICMDCGFVGESGFMGALASTSKSTNRNKQEDGSYMEKPLCDTETIGPHEIKTKLKGESLEELRKLERFLKRKIEVTEGLIESELKTLKKSIQDYYQVKYKIEWVRYQRYQGSLGKGMMKDE
jgi:DNA-directed RNA polymerase subunit RPC12/RpoP